MAEQMVSLWANYEPPETIHFSPDLCKWVTERKTGRLTAIIVSDLIEDNNLGSFLKGEYVIDRDYDCEQLKPFVTFDTPYTQLAFVTNAIISGINEAIRIADIKKVPERLHLEPSYLDETALIANIRITACID